MLIALFAVEERFFYFGVCSVNWRLKNPSLFQLG